MPSDFERMPTGEEEDCVCDNPSDRDNCGECHNCGGVLPITEDDETF